VWARERRWWQLWRKSGSGWDGATLSLRKDTRRWVVVGCQTSSDATRLSLRQRTASLCASFSIRKNVTGRNHMTIRNVIFGLLFCSAFVSAAAPPAPSLSLPVDSASGIVLAPQLSWKASTGANTYTIQVSKSSRFSSFVVNKSAISSTWYNLTGLSNNTKYYWRVRAASALGQASGWSTVWSFTTEALPTIPILSYPENAASSITVSTSLGWSCQKEAAFHVQELN